MTSAERAERAERIRAYHERVAIREMIDRNVKLALTYVRKAENFLYAGPEPEPIPPSSRYWDLLDATLEAALAIVERLPDDFFDSTPVGDAFGLSSALGIDPASKHNSSDGPFERAEELVAAFHKRRAAGKRRRRIEALENTTGRTPAEADAYRAKAEELRR